VTNAAKMNDDGDAFKLNVGSRLSFAWDRNKGRSNGKLR
jgi:hypothetical protein